MSVMSPSSTTLQPQMFPFHSTKEPSSLCSPPLMCLSDLQKQHWNYRCISQALSKAAEQTSYFELLLDLIHSDRIQILPIS